MYQDTSVAVNRDQPQGESVPRIGERGLEICGVVGDFLNLYQIQLPSP
jgi:hypothetical protein